MNKETILTLKRYLPKVKEELNLIGMDIFLEKDQLIFKTDDQILILTEKEGYYLTFKDANDIFILSLYKDNAGFSFNYDDNNIWFSAGRHSCPKNSIFPEKNYLIDISKYGKLKETLYFSSDLDGYYFSIQNKDKLYGLEYGYNKDGIKKVVLTSENTILDEDGTFVSDMRDDSFYKVETDLENEIVNLFLKGYFKKSLELFPNWLNMCRLNSHWIEELEEIYQSMGLEKGKEDELILSLKKTPIKYYSIDEKIGE